MENNKLIEPLPKDNTRINITPSLKKIKLTPEQTIKHAIINKVPEYIYDADKANYYRNLQNFYNSNVFGYGIQGIPTKFDFTTPKGQTTIQSNFDYAKDNVKNFIGNIVISSALGTVSNKSAQIYNKFTKGVFCNPTKNGSLGTLKQYSQNPIGGGAEAIVINNTPTTVGKMTTIPVKEMVIRNQIPNSVQNKYIGFVKDSGSKFPTYIQNRVKILTKQTFPKYIGKLDNAMENSGFRQIKDPNVQYRAYTNGNIVIDDISPGNVGLTSGNKYLDLILPDFLKKPKIIDMIYQTVPEWKAQGFTLKNGGKLIQKCQYGSSLLQDRSMADYEVSKILSTDKVNPYYVDPKLYTTKFTGNPNYLTSKDYKKFAEVMTPIIRKALSDQHLPFNNLNNILRQIGLESHYGTDPRGKQRYNLGGIKWKKGTRGEKYKKTLSDDGEYYIDFDNLKDYADYKVWLLNNTYDAINSYSTEDFVSRLHENNPTKSSYSQNRDGYLYTLTHTKTLDKYLDKQYDN